MFIYNKMVQESFNFSLPQIPRVSLFVEEYELTAPVDVAGGSTGAVMASEAGQTDLFEEFWLFAVRLE
ncbi:MAG: hypothetical protein RPU64_02055 [Candidatus Sedimenticola sp. (ex Thyasira tokunagai)]